MSKPTIDELRQLYAWHKTFGQPDDNHRAKAHQQARRDFNKLIMRVQEQGRADAWDRAIRACEQAIAFPDEDDTIHLPENPYRENQ